MWPIAGVFGCGEQALTSDLFQASEPCIAMAEELLGVGEGAFDRLLSSLVNGLAPGGQAALVGFFAQVLPDMAGQGSHCAGIGRA